MARTAITITDLNRDGVAKPAQQNADTANGMYLAYNDGEVILELGASSGTVVFTFITPGTQDGLAVANRNVSVTAGTDQLVGPFPREVYNQSNGQLYVDVDSANGRLRTYHLN